MMETLHSHFIADTAWKPIRALTLVFATGLAILLGCNADRGAVPPALQAGIAPEEHGQGSAATEVERALRSGRSNALILSIQSPDMEQSSLVRAEIESLLKVPSYAYETEVIWIDPRDPREKQFIEQFRVSPNVMAPVTMVLSAKTGQILDMTSGKTTRNRLAAVLERAKATPSSGCSDG